MNWDHAVQREVNRRLDEVMAVVGPGDGCSAPDDGGFAPDNCGFAPDSGCLAPGGDGCLAPDFGGLAPGDGGWPDSDGCPGAWPSWDEVSRNCPHSDQCGPADHGGGSSSWEPAPGPAQVESWGDDGWDSWRASRGDNGDKFWWRN